jgi:hypothetical protein
MRPIRKPRIPLRTSTQQARIAEAKNPARLVHTFSDFGIADHRESLDQLSDTVVERKRRAIAGPFNFFVRHDVVTLVGILADVGIVDDELGDVRRDPIAQLALRDIGVRQADVVDLALHRLESLDAVQESAPRRGR